MDKRKEANFKNITKNEFFFWQWQKAKIWNSYNEPKNIHGKQHCHHECLNKHKHNAPTPKPIIDITFYFKRLRRKRHM